MTFCPNTFCPNAYLSQKKVNCPKCQKSQLHFVPKTKCPDYILSQYHVVSWKSVPTPQIPIPFLTCKAILPVLMQDTVSPSELSQWLLLSRWIVPNGTGSESRRRLGNRRVGRQPNARFIRAERGLALQRKAQSLIRPMETHQINNYLEVERADSICWEKFERQFVEKVIFKNLEHSWHFCSMLG